MMPTLSPNTQAILLLTAPLIAGHGTSSTSPLTPSEYKHLARRPSHGRPKDGPLEPREYKLLARYLRKIQRQPADLVTPDAANLLRACQPEIGIDESRLQRLLGRGETLILWPPDAKS